MAVIYLDSTSPGGAPGDGLAWSTAWTDTQAALTDWGTGDVIWMAHDHAQPSYTVGTTLSGAGTPAEPIPVYRINSGTDAYEPETDGTGTKNILTTGPNDNLNLQNISWHGVYFEVDGDILAISTDAAMFTDCYLRMPGASRALALGASNGDSVMKFVNCEFNGTSTPDITVLSGTATFDGCTFSGTWNNNGIFVQDNNRGSHVVARNCNFADISDSVVVLVDTSAGGDQNYSYNFENCRWPAPATSFNIMDSGGLGAAGAYVNTIRCGATTEDHESTLNQFEGSAKTNDTTYWTTDGATDLDGDPFSIKMETNANVKVDRPMMSMDIVEWYDSTGTVTVTVEAVENFTTALQDDEAWMEVFYLDGTNIDRTVDSTRTFVGQTQTNLTAGAGLGSWTAEPSGSRSVKFTSGSLAIGKKGFVIARIYLAKFESGKELYYDPQMTIA